MHCPNCGQPTSTELNFCRSCGMKIDSVARAVNQYQVGDVTENATVEEAAIRRRNPFRNIGPVGLLIAFIGIMIGVMGQGMWGAKSASVLLALLGMLIIVFRFLPIAARYDRNFLQSKLEKKELPAAKPKTALPAGDEFKPVHSVTEETTKNLDRNKTKVLK